MSSLPWGARRLVTVVLAVAVAVAAIVAGAGAGGGGATARAAATVTITARDFFWSPEAVTIQVGDAVVWRNEQGFHNVVLGNDDRVNQPGFPDEPPWNPPPQRTFNEPGSFSFFCEVHPAMTGTINVGAVEPTPTPTPPPSPVPPPGSGTPDSTAPAISNLTVTGADGRARVRLTVSERATVNARFATGEDVSRASWQVQQGTWTLEHLLPSGRYDYELWAVDAMGNRSSTSSGQVRVRG
jgi:plastocyanin